MSNSFVLSEEVKQRWAPVLDEASAPKIRDSYMRNVTTVILENTLKDLKESNTTNTGFGAGASYDPVLISMIRRSMPSLIAHDLVGVQPMTMPTGLIFAMRAYYSGNGTGTEALFKTVNSNYAAKVSTAQAEALGFNQPGVPGANTTNPTVWPEMSFAIEKVSVAAESRALKARYTDELAQDLKALHGLDASAELANIMSSEVVAEINREMVGLIYNQAKVTGLSASGSNVFGVTYANSYAGLADATMIDTVNLATDGSGDFQGRWEKEQLQNLMLFLNRMSMEIAQDTRRGLGNTIITSPLIAGALELIGKIDRFVTIDGLNPIDLVGVTYMGVLNGRWKVFIDPYMPTNDIIMGYKGATQYDAGIMYCPYLPLTFMRSRGAEDFQPVMGLKTRYGLAYNPFIKVTTGNENQYYRKVRVLNIPGA